VINEILNFLRHPDVLNLILIVGSIVAAYHFGFMDGRK
jgi:hypothetical protein